MTAPQIAMFTLGSICRYEEASIGGFGSFAAISKADLEQFRRLRSAKRREKFKISRV